MSVNVDADPRDFAEGLPNIGIMLKEITEVDSSLFVTAFWSMLETIEMAFIGTVVGVAIALPLSLLAARNLNNKFVYVPVRRKNKWNQNIPPLNQGLIHHGKPGFYHRQ